MRQTLFLLVCPRNWASRPSYDRSVPTYSLLRMRGTQSVLLVKRRIVCFLPPDHRRNPLLSSILVGALSIGACYLSLHLV